MAGREIVTAYAAGEPTRLRRLRARFRAPIVPGHTVALTHRGAGDGRAHFQVANERGETALAEGYAELTD